MEVIYKDWNTLLDTITDIETIHSKSKRLPFNYYRRRL